MMELQQHAWIVEVLGDILKYARKFDLEDLFESCQLAYDAAVKELGRPPRAVELAQRQMGFVDSIRELIDFAEAGNLVMTRHFLIQALSSATKNWDHPQLAGTVIQLPICKKP